MISRLHETGKTITFFYSVRILRKDLSLITYNASIVLGRRVEIGVLILCPAESFSNLVWEGGKDTYILHQQTHFQSGGGGGGQYKPHKAEFLFFEEEFKNIFCRF